MRILLTGSPEDMKRIEQAGQLGNWCQDNLSWLNKTYGAENIVSAVLHLDETTPHIHATMIPIICGERRKAKAEQAAGENKKRYRKKNTSAVRLCADDVMSRVRLKGYQNTYAEQMAKYGLQRGIEGSEAKHVTTSQYYRDLLTQTESVQANIGRLLEQQQQAERELSKAKADISKERLKNSASDVGAKLMDGVSSLLGTPKMNKIEMENRELKGAIQTIHDENTGLRQWIKDYKAEVVTDITALQADYHKGLKKLEAHYVQREEELVKESNGLKSVISKLFQWFPYAQEMLRMEKLVRAVGFTVEQVGKLLAGQPLSFRGSLYSEEHKRKFETESSTAKVAQDNEAKKLHLIVDGTHITDWFKMKYEEYTQRNVQVQPPNRGMKM